MRAAAAIAIVTLVSCKHAASERCPVATPLRSMSASSSEDDSDLEPLARAIGDATVVALGEARHDDALGVAAKVRLTRFLRRRLGFDVIAIESGLWDCVRLEDDVASGVPMADAMKRHLFPNWAANEALRSFLAENAASATPMRLVGIDPQFSGDPRGDDYLASVERDLARASLALPDDLRAHVIDASTRLPKRKKFVVLDAAVREADRSVFRDLRRWLVDHRPTLASALGEERADLVVRSVDDVLVLYAWHEAVAASQPIPNVDFDHHAALNDVRDAAMADNLLFWRARLPSRRIVLWTATTHAQRRAPFGADATQLGYDLRGFVPMGERLSAALGAQYFALGVTAPSQPSGRWAFVDLHDSRCPRRFAARAIGDVDFVRDWPGSLDAFVVEP